MNIWIRGRRISVSDEYLQHVRRDTLIREQVRYLSGIASEADIAEAMGEGVRCASSPKEADAEERRRRVAQGRGRSDSPLFKKPML